MGSDDSRDRHKEIRKLDVAGSIPVTRSTRRPRGSRWNRGVSFCPEADEPTETSSRTQDVPTAEVPDLASVRRQVCARGGSCTREVMRSAPFGSRRPVLEASASTRLVNVQYLARRHGQRQLPLYGHEPCGSPLERHHLLAAGSGADGREESVDQGPGLDRADGWIHPEPQPTSAIAALLLHDLVVGRSSSRRRRSTVRASSTESGWRR